MGIRIHKAIGYGLNDLEENDPRINPLGWLGKETKWDEKEEIWATEGFLKYYRSQSDFPIYANEIKKQFEAYRSVIHDDEYGMENMLLISPSWHKDWHRYDNIIDYVESTKGVVNLCKVLTYGIWPYVGQFNDLRTYRSADESFAKEFWYNINSISCARKKKQRQDHMTIAAACTKGMEFESVDEAMRMIVPAVPQEIELLCRWLNLFNEETTIMELRPMIYTYWS